MTESDCWQQIEQYAIEGNWTGVGVLGDWLQDKGIAEGDTLSWLSRQQGPRSWIAYYPPKDKDYDPDWYCYLPSCNGGKHNTFQRALQNLHSYRSAILSLLT